MKELVKIEVVQDAYGNPCKTAAFVEGGTYRMPANFLKSASVELAFVIKKNTHKTVVLDVYEKYAGTTTIHSGVRKTLNPGGRGIWTTIDGVEYAVVETFNAGGLSRWCREAYIDCFTAEPGDLSSFQNDSAPTKGAEKKTVEAVTVEACEYTPVYYEIDESMAKLNKELHSFDDYTPGTATAKYKKQIDYIYSLVAKSDDPKKSAYLANVYAKKYANYLNSLFAVEALCPSAAIVGPAAIDSKKLTKQDARRGKLAKMWEGLENLEAKIEYPRNYEVKRETIDVSEFDSVCYFDVVANEEANRLQLVNFEDRPDDEQRNVLKKHGFKWSPRFKAWQRQLTENAVAATWAVVAIYDEANKTATKEAAEATLAQRMEEKAMQPVQKQEQDQTFKTLLEVSPQQVQPINWDIFWDARISDPVIVGGGRRVSLKPWRQARIYINSVAPAVDSRTGNHYAKSCDSLGYIDYDGVYYAPKEGLPGDYTADDVDAVVNAFRCSQAHNKLWSADVFNEFVHSWITGRNHCHGREYTMAGTLQINCFGADNGNLKNKTCMIRDTKIKFEVDAKVLRILVFTEYGTTPIGLIVGNRIGIYSFAFDKGFISTAAADELVKIVDHVIFNKTRKVELINADTAKAILDNTNNDADKVHFDNLVVDSPRVEGFFEINDSNTYANAIASLYGLVEICDSDFATVPWDTAGLDKDQPTTAKAIVSYLAAIYDSASVLAAQIKISGNSVDVKQVLKDIAQEQKHSQKTTPTRNYIDFEAVLRPEVYARFDGAHIKGLDGRVFTLNFEASKSRIYINLVGGSKPVGYIDAKDGSFSQNCTGEYTENEKLAITGAFRELYEKISLEPERAALYDPESVVEWLNVEASQFLTATYAEHDIKTVNEVEEYSKKVEPTKTETSTTEPITTETTAATPKKVVSTLPISKSWVMSRAWTIRKAIAAQLGCKVRDVSMSYALRRAWAEAKAEAELDTTVYYATVNGAVVGYADAKSEAQKLAEGGSVAACTLPKAE